MRLALFEPDIPQNCGTILRLAACLGVAMDIIELEAIEKKRTEKGVPSLWHHDPNSITEDSHAFYHDATKNLFFRQPGHVAAAGKLGLGIADLKQIDHRTISA